MSTAKRTLFISDLHLDESQPLITGQFLQLLKDCDDKVDALYILGDFFEVWIGDDDYSPFHEKIIQALKAATNKGLSIYFMHGNRDFLLGKKFFKQTGSRLLGEEEKINLYGTPILLMHGDLLCTRDINYLKARKIAFNPLFKKFALLFPLSLRRLVARKLRNKSAQHKKMVAADIMDVTHEEVIRVMQKHNVHYLIHGHTHRPAFHELTINSQPAMRIVLAAWHGHGSVLSWDESGKKEMIQLHE